MLFTGNLRDSNTTLGDGHYSYFTAGEAELGGVG